MDNKLYKEALDFHSQDPKGKIAISLPKKLICLNRDFTC